MSATSKHTQITLHPKKVLCLFAHPDDETFGPGGTLATWAKEGASIHIICMTHGEAGTHDVEREHELRAAAKLLGVKSVEVLNFQDGKIGNNDLQELEKTIVKYIEKYSPDTLLTFDLNGVSGHLDHIAVASATTQAFKKTNIAKQLCYFTLSKAASDREQDYFIHFPEGRLREHVDMVINIEPVWELRVTAMHLHQSQIHDVLDILETTKDLPKEELFMVSTKA